MSSAAVVIGALRVNVRDYFSVLVTQLLCILFCTLSVVVAQKEVIKHLSTFFKKQQQQFILNHTVKPTVLKADYRFFFHLFIEGLGK